MPSSSDGTCTKCPTKQKSLQLGAVSGEKHEFWITGR